MSVEEKADLRERIKAVRVLAGKAATQTDYTSAGEKAIRLLPEILAVLNEPRAPRGAIVNRVSEEMVDAYVSAVNAYLGSLTEYELQADLEDQRAALKRVARIGLEAAISKRQDDSSPKYNAEAIIDLIWAANNARFELRMAVGRKDPLARAKIAQREAIVFIDQALEKFQSAPQHEVTK